MGPVDQGVSGSSGFKPNPSLFPHILEAENAEQEAGTAEPLGSPAQVAVSVDLDDPVEAEVPASPTLLDPILITVSSVVPTVTSETVSVICCNLIK